MILDCLLGEEVLKLFQLSGILRGEIVGLAEVLGYMVKFPSVLGERRKRHHQPWNGMTRACHPAIVINSAVSKHFEILSREIGKASCRERVEISGVVGSLK